MDNSAIHRDSSAAVTDQQDAGDLFYIDVVCSQPKIRAFLTERVKELLSDPSIDATIMRILQEETAGRGEVSGGTAPQGSA